MKPSKRHVLLVATIVVAVAVGAGGAGTYAYLTDSGETSILFTSGSLDVTNSPDSLDFGPDDESTHTATIEVKNEGTLPARQVALTEIELEGPNSTKVAKALEVQEIRFNETNVTGNVTAEIGDRNGNGLFDVHDVASYVSGPDELVLQNGSVLGSGESVEFSVDVELDYSQPGIVGDEMEMRSNVRFTGYQEPA